MYERLPQELKDDAVFCGWKYEQRSGGRTKVPKTVTGRNADISDPASFCSFDEILKKAGNFDGIGIAVKSDLTAIDIDHSVVDGNLTELARSIVDKTRSYTEISPSGKGIRIIGKTAGFVYDREKYYINNRKLALEIYTSGGTNRFVTVTGNAISDHPLRDISDVLPEILETYMRRPEIQRPEDRIDAPGSFLTDEEVVDKASSASNNEKFLSLYGGDIAGYPSQSEAELAFMTMLAFWCGGDEEQMDRIYRSSGLYREKWERDDYRESTISRAVMGASSFYVPVLGASVLR